MQKQLNRRANVAYQEKRTHCTNRIKQTLLRMRLRQASLVTLPPSPITPTHGRPRPVDPGTTTAKQHVIVHLVLFPRRTATPE